MMSLDHSVGRHILRHREPLCLQPGAHYLVRVCCNGCRHLGDGRAEKNSRACEGHIRVVLRPDFQLFVERKLDGDMRDSQQARQKSAVECT
jgi:hypothetical protein